MVKNKRELLATAGEWVNHAKNDLRQNLVAFMEKVGADQNRIADVLGLSVAEVDQILNGNGEISLSTFAKLLIATDNAIVIAPVQEIQRQAGMNPARNRRGYPTPEEMAPVAPQPTCVPQPVHAPAPHAPHRPSAMPMGQMMEIDLDTLNREQLVEIALQEGLDREMNLMTASRSQIIDRLEEKQQAEMANGQFPCNEDPNIRWDDVDEDWGNEEDEDWEDENEAEMEEDWAEEPCCDEPERNHCQGNTCDFNDSRLAQMIMQELENNPTLKNIIKRHI